jgi:POT family proton-dependent oligopeptide transporter
MNSIKNNLSNLIRDVMPVGAGALCFIQMFSTLGFSVLYFTLVLYMTGKLGFPDTTANSVMGVFLAFNYALHLLGGYFGGRFLSNRTLFCVGMLVQLVGALLLMFPTQMMLYWGLAFFLIGAGLNVTCLNCMVTQLFEPDDKRREAAFLWNYSGMNIGFFVGFTMSGHFQLTGEYDKLFMWSGIGYVGSLALMAIHWQKLADRQTTLTRVSSSESLKRGLFGILLIALMIPVMHFFTRHALFSNNLVLVVGALMLLGLLVLAFRQPEVARRKMQAYLIFSLAALIFFSLYHVQAMGLTLFIEHNVANTIWGYVIPPQWVQNLNTIVIVIGGPVLSVAFRALRKRGFEISLPFQFALALILIGIGFVILPFGIAWANPEGLTNFNWVIACYIFQSTGELFLGPIGYAMVGQMAPVSLQGVMMGTWMMLSGVGGALSHYFSNMMVSDVSSSPLLTNPNFSHTFGLIGWFSVIAGGVLFLCYPWVYALTHGKSWKEMKRTELKASEAN